MLPASGPASVMDCGPVLWVASPWRGHLADTLSLVSIPVSFCSWLDFLVAPRTWLTVPGSVDGPQVQCCYTKSPSLAELCLLGFQKTPEKKIPLCYLIPTGSTSCSAPRANGVSRDFIRERKKEDQDSHPAGLQALVLPLAGAGCRARSSGQSREATHCDMKYHLSILIST